MMFLRIRTTFCFLVLAIFLQNSNIKNVEAVVYESAAAIGGIGAGLGGGLFGNFGIGNLLSSFLPAHLGILGPIKLALMSKAGLALGIIGTALGGSALGLALRDDEHSYYHGNDYYDYNDQSSYSSYGHYDKNHNHNYRYNHVNNYHGNNYRKRRDTSDVLDVNKEENFEFVYKSDKDKCTEKLICELAYKYSNSRTSLKMDEFSILLMVKSNPKNAHMQSKAHQLFDKALRQGVSGSNCKTLYPICKYNGDNLMDMIRLFSTPFDGASVDKVASYIRS